MQLKTHPIFFKLCEERMNEKLSHKQLKNTSPNSGGFWTDITRRDVANTPRDRE